MEVEIASPNVVQSIIENQDLRTKALLELESKY